MAGKVLVELSVRFWQKAQRGSPDECWEWTASGSKDYGTFYDHGRSRQAHRVAWELTNGPVPDDLPLDHLCRNKRCVNPGHLEPVSQKTNLHRGNGWAGRHVRATHCPQGHPYNAANTYRKQRRTHVSRECRQCDRDRHRACPELAEGGAS